MDIKLHGDRYCGNTIISNFFLDNFLADANEAQLKIYLYLSRCIGSDTPVDVSSIADRFNYTEKDVIRALTYWSKAGIITLEFDKNREISGITLNDPMDAAANAGLSESIEAAPADTPQFTAIYKPSKKEIHYPASKVNDFEKKPEVRELIFAVESYMRQTLSRRDMESILFMYDELEFPVELIEFLVEHSIESGASGMNYFLEVAFAWSEKGIRTVEDAKEYVRLHSRNVYAVMKEFGISGRNITPGEADYLDKWENKYGFDIEIIKEAASRTIKRLAKPSFTYADTILTSWHDAGVQSLEDIAELDRRHSESTKAAYSSYKGATAKAPANRFKNFSERDYDMDELEKELTAKSRAKAGKL